MILKEPDNPEITAFNKEDIKYLSKEDEEIIETTDHIKKVMKKRIRLKLFKPAFEPKPKHKWDLFYNDNVIHALILDDSFFRKVLDRKVSFKNGDSLECDLQIVETKNQEFNVFQPDSYNIKKVYKVHHLPKQESIL